MNMDLMLVDDASDQIYLMQMLLKTVNPDIKIVATTSGDEALKVLNDESRSLPRVVLLDLKLAGKTGLEVLKELKNNPRLKRLPVCMFSNSNLEADVCEAYELGANFYFRKPVGLAELKKFIENFVTVWFGYASVCSS